jgi:hypothetical protein
MDINYEWIETIPAIIGAVVGVVATVIIIIKEKKDGGGTW